MYPRFYVNPEGDAVQPGGMLSLPEDVAHHALRVLRLRAGMPIILFDGQGHAWDATLQPPTGKAEVHVMAARPPCPEPRVHITLVQALPAADKMDWIIQKAVECGASAIQPVLTQRSVIRLTPERRIQRVRHWRQVAISACAQSGRDTLPNVADLLDLEHYLAQRPTFDASCWRLAPGASIGLRAIAQPQALVFAVGPEGGFDRAEEAMLDAAGFLPVCLGPRILRTETAGMAAINASLALWDE